MHSFAFQFAHLFIYSTNIYWELSVCQVLYFIDMRHSKIYVIVSTLKKLKSVVKQITIINQWL